MNFRVFALLALAGLVSVGSLCVVFIPGTPAAVTVSPFGAEKVAQESAKSPFASREGISGLKPVQFKH